MFTWLNSDLLRDINRYVSVRRSCMLRFQSSSMGNRSDWSFTEECERDTSTLVRYLVHRSWLDA
ncbi:hypothetical protein X777_14605 [Ooceraea biroi]|uniref:Uncharacterized protein n=1 Tax=Ooceraea biroi TaxID=2015173 RepID=A0A026WZL3_OOCBI|nr:hypothetical protein X777_14605 [Ooceraea biroi]